MLGLTACGFFSVTASGGCFLGVECWLLIAVASHSWRTGSGTWASVVMAHGLGCSVARGIFPDQGSNLCPLHQQADSLPLSFREAPNILLFALGSSEVAVGTSRDLLPRIRPNCVCTQLSLAPYGFFVFCCWERPLSGCRSCSKVAQIPVCLRAVRYFSQVKGESISCSVVSDCLGPCGL